MLWCDLPKYFPCLPFHLPSLCCIVWSVQIRKSVYMGRGRTQETYVQDLVENALCLDCDQLWKWKRIKRFLFACLLMGACVSSSSWYFSENTWKLIVGLRIWERKMSCLRWRQPGCVAGDCNMLLLARHCWDIRELRSMEVRVINCVCCIREWEQGHFKPTN